MAESLLVKVYGSAALRRKTSCVCKAGQPECLKVWNELAKEDEKGWAALKDQNND